MHALQSLIGPDDGTATALQLCVRAIILFFFGILCIRVAGRRTFSQATPLDIVVAIVVGSNLARAMTGRAEFWPTLAATLVFVGLHRALAMLSLHWSWLARMLKAGSVVLVRDGVVDRARMHKHGIGLADLDEALRLEQVSKLEDVDVATLEASGRISVIPKT